MIYDLIIIGYGVSGLSCAKVAKTNNLNFLVLEKSNELGGCWNDALEYTTLQTHRQFYQYRDFKMPRKYGDYPSKTNVLQYLRTVESYFNLDKHIKFNQNVKSIVYTSTSWSIKCQSQSQSQSQSQTVDKIYNAKYICVCSGYYSQPLIPPVIELYQNRFKGKIYHSSQLNKLTNLKCFEGKKVVIVGNGASASDFLGALDAEKIKCCQYVIYRSNKYYITKYIAGLSSSLILTQKIIKFFKHLPTEIYRQLFVGASYLIFRNFLDLPIEKVNSHNLIGNTIIPNLVKSHQLIYIRDTINYLENHEIYMSHTMILNVDYLVCCTGYQKNYLPFQVWINGREIVYDNINYLQILNPIIPQCGFIGMAPSYNWLVNSDKQAQWFIKNIVLGKQYISKEIMTHEITRHQKKQNIHYLDYEDLTYELFTYLEK